MSDTTIDNILNKLQWIANRNEGLVTSDIEQAKSALYDLIDKKIIGEDEPDETDKWTPEMADVISATRRIIYGRNALRAEQRNKLAEIFGDNNA